MTSSGPTACWRWLSGDLTGEERGRDRGNPLAEHREPVWVCPARPRRTATRRSRSERWTISSLSLDACPSPRDLSGRRLHRRPGARQPGGASLPRLLLLLPSALHCVGRPDFVFAVAACERRPGGGRGGGAGAGAHSQALAGDQNRRSRRRWLLPRRDVVRRQRGRLPVRLVPQRPPDRAQAVAQVAPPLRLDRRGVAAVLRLPLPDPNVVEPDAAGGGAAGSLRRPFRRDFPGLQAGGGADPLRETVLRARGKQDQGAATRPVRRPDLDRDHAGEPVAPRLRDVRQPRRRFGGLAWTAPGRTGRRPGRFGRNFSRSPSAFRFGGFCSRFRRPGPGRSCSPGSWRTCGCRRPQPDAVRGLDSPFSKAGTPATGQVCSGHRGVGVARNRKRSWFVQEKALLADCALLPRTASRPENRAGNPDLASGFALVRYAG